MQESNQIQDIQNHSEKASALDWLITAIPPNVEIPDLFFETLKKAKNMTPEQFTQWQCDRYNEQPGKDSTGIECEICHNKGYIAFVDAEGNECTRKCACWKARQTILEIQSVGLGKQLEKCKFENFQTDQPFRKIMLEYAMKYLQSSGETWFFIGGQSGCGKTHLCTAICYHLIQQDRHVKYMCWRDDIYHILESYRYKADLYADFMQAIRNYDILYIDDFLKTSTAIDASGETKQENGVDLPSQPNNAELAIAYEIINAREQAGKKTIISSEHHSGEISRYDAAIGGRIKANAGKGTFTVNIARYPERDFRVFDKEDAI